MKDKLKDWGFAGIQDSSELAIYNSVEQDAYSALLALGYKPQDTKQVLTKYKEQDLSSAELIKLLIDCMSKVKR